MHGLQGGGTLGPERAQHTDVCTHTYTRAARCSLTCLNPCEGSSDTVQETFAHADLISCLEQGRKQTRLEKPSPSLFSLLHTHTEGGERRGGEEGAEKRKAFFLFVGRGNNEDGCVAVMNFSSGPKCNCNAWISASGRGLAVAVGFFFVATDAWG